MYRGIEGWKYRGIETATTKRQRDRGFLEKINLVIDNKEYKDVYVAQSFMERFKGLMFVHKQKAFNLLIKNCNSIHTCFMRFNIDVYCLDKDFNVVKKYINVRPFRFILPVKNTCHILETKNERGMDV